MSTLYLKSDGGFIIETTIKVICKFVSQKLVERRNYSSNLCPISGETRKRFQDELREIVKLLAGFQIKFKSARNKFEMLKVLEYITRCD